jgi:hypothetical protein
VTASPQIATPSARYLRCSAEIPTDSESGYLKSGNFYYVNVYFYGKVFERCVGGAGELVVYSRNCKNTDAPNIFANPGRQSKIILQNKIIINTAVDLGRDPSSGDGR